MPRFVIFDKTENEDRIFILYRCPTDLIRKLQNQAIMQAVLAKKNMKKKVVLDWPYIFTQFLVLCPVL